MEPGKKLGGLRGEGPPPVDANMRPEWRLQQVPAVVPPPQAGAPLQKEPAGDEGEKSVAPEPVTVISSGRTLIIDTDPKRAEALGKVLTDRKLNCTLTVLKGPTCVKQGHPPRPGHLEPAGVSVTGVFGNFAARIIDREGQRNPSLVGREERRLFFDLVLDLQAEPSYEGTCPPLGYYATRSDSAALAAALAELPEMKGQFTKPRFISWRKKLCFHGRSVVRDCRRCLEICSFGAIHSEGGQIFIDAALCQGCGGCALVCPAQALQLQEQSPKALLTQLQDRLKGWSASPDVPLTLVMTDSETRVASPGSGLDESRTRPRVYFRVDPIAQAGLEVSLMALAYGAEEVLLVSGPATPPGIRNALADQVQMGRAILRGLGLPEDRIRYIPGDPPESLGYPKYLQRFEANGSAGPVPVPPVPSSLGPYKREMVRLAVQHLYEKSGAGSPELPLPPGAPFGTVLVDRETCTLCLACVSACPPQALSSGGQTPQLKFRENLCHQCGICQAVCPEGAIRLLPRLFCDRETVETRRVLQEEDPFHCVECGQAFASPALIRRLQEKLRGHWMYAGERRLRRLQMCSTCRAREALTSEDLSPWKSP